MKWFMKGKDGDIILYDNDPLHYLANTKLVLVRREVIYKEEF